MSGHLLAMSIGPIQDFIAAGRRTRDLWRGSKLLSEISRAAAKAVQEVEGQAIFPGPVALKDPEAGIANVILVEVTVGHNPGDIQRRAREACEKYWKDQAWEAERFAGKLLRRDVWNAQIEEHVIEFYSAWTPLVEGQYKLCRQRVMHLLAGRKQIRNFERGRGFDGVPKSSLDGARESVIVEIEDRSRDIPADKARVLRLSRGEQLDIVGLTKRASEPKGFRSASRIAADTWLREMPEESRDRLKKKCKTLADLRELISVPDKVFEYEGTVAYKSRHRDLARENGALAEGDTKLPDRYAELAQCVQELESAHGAPDPYLACIRADGDNIGAALSEMKRIEDHRAFSDKLAEFANEAKGIVEKNWGSLVYSGGDDVLAFVPVKQALQCARQLHRRFADLVVPLARGSSLSVGIAIGHFLEHMEDLLQFAKDAEKHAKKGDEKTPIEQQKNGLAMHVHPRGGAPVKVRARWEQNLEGRMKQWTEAYLTEGLLSRKSAYDLKRLAEDYSGWPDEMFRKAFPLDAARVLHGKRTSQEIADEIKKLFQGLSSYKEAVNTVNEFIVARRFAAAVRQPSKVVGKGGRRLELPLAD